MRKAKKAKGNETTLDALNPGEFPKDNPVQAVQGQSVLEMLREGIVDTGMGGELSALDEKIAANLGRWKIKSELYIGRITARVFYEESAPERGFALVYDDTRKPGYEAYVSALFAPEIREYYASLWAKGTNCYISQSMIVKTEQYRDPNITDSLTKIIVNTIILGKRSEDITSSQFCLQNLVVDIDAPTAAAQMQAWACPSTTPRHDLGFVVYLQEEDTVQLPRADHNRTMVKHPMFAVTAFVDIRRVGNPQLYESRPMFRPIVTITSITSALPGPGILPMAIAYAADIFISNGGWKEQFRGGKKNKNLGHLLRDEKGKLMSCVTEQDIDKFVAEHVLHIANAGQVFNGTNIGTPDVGLALELQAGLVEVDGLDYLATGREGLFAELCGEFFQAERAICPQVTHGQNYGVTLGTAIVDRQEIDGRHLDYLMLAEKSKDPNLEKLLYPLQEEKRIVVQNELLGGGVTPSDIAIHFEFNNDFLSDVIGETSKALRNKYVQYVDDTQITQPQQTSIRTPGVTRRSTDMGQYLF